MATEATRTLPRSARVVVVGGGVVGCSVAYHLTKRGVEDVVLLERKQLTSGTTWHAAGLVGQLRGSQNMTKLAKYTAELYRGLEAETGQATGFKQNGSISLATTPGRFEELRRMASMAKVFDLRVDVLGPEDVASRYPLIRTDDVVGAIAIPSDGQANPVDVTQALAKGARQRGAKIFEHTAVTALHKADGRVVAVATERGEIACDFVVLCTGMWTRELAQSIGVHVPLHACEHYYLVTEVVPDLPPDLPVLRDYDACAYYKEDAGKILLGAFEPVAKPWGMDGIPEAFCFDELPGDFAHFEPILTAATRRLPLLNEVGIQTFFCGPESFTPDVRYHLGAAPEVDRCFVAAGLNSIGIQSAGGIGRVLADWIVDGYPPMDLWEVDVRRNQPFQANRTYLHDRVRESLGLLYAMHWPHRQPQSSRGVRRSPFYDRLGAAGAVYGSAFGWERPNWFAPPGTAPVYAYSYQRQNWFGHSAREHRAVRETVGLFDQSSFAKFRVTGMHATRELNRICANDIDVPPGRIVYTQWLNERGGIEADLTVTRLGDDDYRIVTSGETAVRDRDHLRRHIDPAAQLTVHDETSALAVLSLMGPNSRALLARLSPDDLSHQGFPFATSRDIEVGYARVRAARITYVGELGFELYIPSEFALGVYESILAVGAEFGLRHAGYHALDSLRIEKAYRHWGHDLCDEDSPLEAGLMGVVKLNKPGGFVGRDALMRQIEAGRTRALVQFLLEDPEPLLYHNEPVWRGESIVGYIRSGAYGHTLGGAVGLGYVCDAGGIDDAAICEDDYEIEIAGTRYAARASLAPFYDPDNRRIRC